MNGLRTLLGLFVLAVVMLGLAACNGEMMDTEPAIDDGMGEEEMAMEEEGEVIYRVNAGAIEEYTDEEGNVWMADQMLTPDKDWGALFGATVSRGDVEIEGTKAPGVYQSERFDMANYTFSVEPGTYDVKLHFAETFDGIASAGERVFDVKVNGETKLESIDPYKMGGGLYKPVVKTIEDVMPNEDGKIIIEFVRDVQNPEVNGIQIIAK